MKKESENGTHYTEEGTHLASELIEMGYSAGDNEAFSKINALIKGSLSFHYEKDEGSSLPQRRTIREY